MTLAQYQAWKAAKTKLWAAGFTKAARAEYQETLKAIIKGKE